MELKYEDIRQLVEYIDRNSSFKIKSYSKNSLLRRFNKFLNMNSEFKGSANSVLVHIINNKDYIQEIINQITVPTTEMFRNPILWTGLKEVLISNFKKDQQIDVLINPCSTGEELYSMAILMETYGFKNRTLTGVDINTRSLEMAEEGEYIRHLFDKNAKNFNDSKIDKRQHLLDYFNTSRRSVTVKDLLKKDTYFYNNDNLSSFKIKKYDFVFCRNLLIYFEDELQKEFLLKLTRHLKSGGYLVLGMCEALKDPEVSLKYEIIDGPNRIFKKK